MAPEQETSELVEIARAHHVHFDVEPEVLVRPKERVKVGFDVRLWAVHVRGARALPGCAKCRELAADLLRIAEWATPAGERETRIEIEPFHAALYESTVVPGADEVELTIRLIHRDGYDQPIDAGEERCLKEMRRRLRALGIAER
jgi:hypothetical protein